MNELAQNLTSLPNLHPAVLHFPLAVLPIAVIFDLVGVLVASQRHLVRSGLVLYVIGIISTGLTYWAGREAASELSLLEPVVEVSLARHSDWALYTTWTLAVLVAARLILASKGLETTARTFRFAVLGSLIVAVVALCKTADLGGSLVYEHGVAVETVLDADSEVRSVEPVPMLDLAPAPPADGLIRIEGGGLVWKPTAADGPGIRNLFVVDPPEGIESVGEPGREVGAPGVRLRVEQRAAIVFAADFDDVQATLTFEVIDFEGEIAVVHHFDESGDGGWFALSTAGSVELVDRRGGENKTLDRRTGVTIPEGSVTISVSSVGRHLKGFFGAEMMTHGHISSHEPGRCGIRFEGDGDVRISVLEITPADGHS